MNDHLLSELQDSKTQANLSKAMGDSLGAILWGYRAKAIERRIRESNHSG